MGNNSRQQIILDALDSIPLIKNGKRGMTQLNGFHDDIQILKRFKEAVLRAKKSQLESLEQQWRQYTYLREEDNWVSFHDTANISKYATIFQPFDK